MSSCGSLELVEKIITMGGWVKHMCTCVDSHIPSTRTPTYVMRTGTYATHTKFFNSFNCNVKTNTNQCEQCNKDVDNGSDLGPDENWLYVAPSLIQGFVFVFSQGDSLRLNHKASSLYFIWTFWCSCVAHWCLPTLKFLKMAVSSCPFPSHGLLLEQVN